MSPLVVGLLACLALYLPLYLDRRERRGSAFKPRVACWPGWRFVWRRVFRMPLAEVRLHDAAAFGSPGAQRIYGSHPHGVASLHHMGMMMCPPVCKEGASFEAVCPQAGRHELAASVLFRLPGLRERALAVGCIDASRGVVDRALRAGKSIGLMVGGEQEQLLSRRGRHVVYVNARKGIVKMALRHGVPLVPCYCFGESELYHHSAFALRLRQAIARTLGVAITLAYGRSLLLPFLPRPTALTQVVGTPIAVAKVEEPTAEQIDALHAAYVRGLREVFDAHKAELGYADAQLEVV